MTTANASIHELVSILAAASLARVVAHRRASAISGRTPRSADGIAACGRWIRRADVLAAIDVEGV